MTGSDGAVSTFADRWGAPVRAGSAGAVTLLDRAVEDLVALAGDPVGAAEAAIAADADLALARIYRAYLSLYATTAEGIAEASALIKPLEAGPAGALPPREGQHLAAARAWADGDWQAAARALERALVACPRDVWGVHALAHVFEMEGRHEPGVAFLSSSAPDWSGSYFAVHNWWHLGLYLLELGRAGDALALYHERVRAARSAEWLDIVDAAALLWRLSLCGTDVAGPAAALAADISGLAADQVYRFNDWHAVMTFGLAGDYARAGRVLAASRHLTRATGRQVAERAGLRLLEGFAAFAAGDPAAAAELLAGVRGEAYAVGGSHAQRDVIDLTLIAAAARSGQASLTRALVAERTARKPAAAPSAAPSCWPTRRRHLARLVAGPQGPLRPGGRSRPR